MVEFLSQFGINQCGIVFGIMFFFIVIVLRAYYVKDQALNEMLKSSHQALLDGNRTRASAPAVLDYDNVRIRGGTRKGTTHDD